MQTEINLKKSKKYLVLSLKYVNLCDNKGKSPLHYAAMKGKTELVKILFKYNAIPIIRDYKIRVILQFCQTFDIETIRCL